MTDVQLAYTQLAFRELRQFSIPGIGTFVKKLAGAQVDMTRNVIYPPAERFEFTPGGATYAAQFVGLLERKQHMAAAQASAVVEELGQALLRQVKARKSVDIPGIGKLVLAADDTLAFTLTSEDPTLQTYGLTPVAYGGRTEEVLEKDLPKSKKKGQDKALRKPENMKVKAQQLKKEKKRTRLLAVVALLLLAGLAAGIISVWPQIERELFKNQVKADDILAEDSNDPGKRAADPQKQSASQTATPRKPAEDSTVAGKTTTAEKPNVTLRPKSEPAQTPKSQPKPSPKPAVTPQAAPAPVPQGEVTYRLVLAQTFDQARAEEEKGFWAEYGGVVVPIGGGRYTIQFFSSKSRAAVLSKQQAMITSGVFYHASQTKVLP
ncbi:MAG: hypothetical protein KF690_02220 [Bacteroidetes bacterium]|nr:hypothetical protein [Bacteroidota bacterium]